MTSALHLLMKTAAAGTAMAAVPAETGSPALDSVLESMAETPAERRLLAAAGSLAVYATAGAESLEAGELPPAAETDDRPAFPQRTATLLERLPGGDLHTLMPAVLAFMAENRVRLPESLLPDFLNAREQYRRFVRPVLGSRGLWLAAQNPDWSWALEDTAPGARPGEPHDLSALESTWQEEDTGERLAVLRRVRSIAPDTARAWLEDTWSREKAEQRASFLETLKEGLGRGDIPFLEGIAGDRGQKVRSTRFLLLATLPGTSVSKGLDDHAGFLRISRSGPGGAPRMQVLAPEEPGPFWQESGISVKAPQGIGHKSWLLRQMLSLVPLDFWRDRLEASPEELIRAAQQTEWPLPIMEGWSRSAISMPGAGWLPALVGWWRDFRTDESDNGARGRLLRSELLAELVTADPAQHSALAALLLANDPDPTLPWDDILRPLERPWPVSVAAAWLESMRDSVKRHADDYHHAWLATLPLAAGALPDQCLSGAVRQWDLPENRDSESWAMAAWRKALAEFAERIEMRRAISEEIRRICGRDGGAE